MSAGWVAAGVRGRGLAGHRVGREAARAVAAAHSLGVALDLLAATPYGRRLSPDMDLGAAQRAVSASMLWDLRVLAGWGPPVGSGPLRLLAGPFELANIVDHLAQLGGHPMGEPYDLGSLATAWPGVRSARSLQEVRATLRASTWGDPGSDELAMIRVALQLGWLRQVAEGAPGAGDWAVGWAGLVLARVVAAGVTHTLSRSARRDAAVLAGGSWQDATSIGDLARRVPPPAAEALQGVVGRSDLWRAEARWWDHVESAATALMERPRLDASAAVGATALLAADARRVRAALAVAARGGDGGGIDVAGMLDAVA